MRLSFSRDDTEERITNLVVDPYIHHNSLSSKFYEDVMLFVKSLEFDFGDYPPFSIPSVELRDKVPELFTCMADLNFMTDWSYNHIRDLLERAQIGEGNYNSMVYWGRELLKAIKNSVGVFHPNSYTNISTLVHQANRWLHHHKDKMSNLKISSGRLSNEDNSRLYLYTTILLTPHSSSRLLNNMVSNFDYISRRYMRDPVNQTQPLPEIVRSLFNEQLQMCKTFTKRKYLERRWYGTQETISDTMTRVQVEYAFKRLLLWHQHTQGSFGGVIKVTLIKSDLN